MLQAGVNDVGGTLNGENISRAAGAKHGQMLGKEQFEALCRPLGRKLVQRTTLYDTLVDNNSRPRFIPVVSE